MVITTVYNLCLMTIWCTLVLSTLELHNSAAIVTTAVYGTGMAAVGSSLEALLKRRYKSATWSDSNWYKSTSAATRVEPSLFAPFSRSDKVIVIFIMRHKRLSVLSRDRPAARRLTQLRAQGRLVRRVFCCCFRKMLQYINNDRWEWYKAHTHASTHAQTHAGTQTPIHARTHVRTHARTHARKHTHTHTHTHRNTGTHLVYST